MNPAIYALFTRALRLESRSLWTYAARLGLIGVILFFMVVYHVESSRLGAPGLEFFKFVMFINLSFVTLAGASYFATAISEEKDEMTLGLLRMTRLSPLALLLGKSAVRMMGAVTLLLAQVPFTMLAVTLGGISTGQIAAAYVTLLAYIVLLSGWGTLCSVVASRSTGAGTLATVGLALFFFGPLLGTALMDAATYHRWWGIEKNGALDASVYAFCKFFTDGSPFDRMEEVLATGFSGAPAGVQAIYDLALGVGFFLLAWWSFDLFNREVKEAAPARGLLTRTGGRLPWLAPERVWPNALLWKDFYFLTGGRLMLVGKTIFYIVLFFGIYLVDGMVDRSPWDFDDYCHAMKYVYTFVLFLELANYAGKVFREETRWQTLSSLIVLPLTTHQLAYRKIAGCLLGVVPIAGCTVAVTLLAWFLNRNQRVSWDIFYFQLHLVAEGIFFLHLAAYLSLRMKQNALAVSIGVFLLLQMVLGMLSAMCMGVFLLGGGFIVTLLLASAVLHRKTGLLLEAKAAE
jgi:ABC-type transport system involved in multi-copper enzyme maturation permease subunit